MFLLIIFFLKNIKFFTDFILTEIQQFAYGDKFVAFFQETGNKSIHAIVVLFSGMIKENTSIFQFSVGEFRICL